MQLRDHQKEITQIMQRKCGQVLVPTGGGKTMCMIVDAKWRLSMPIPVSYTHLTLPTSG